MAMTPDSSPYDAASLLREWANDPSPKRGFLFVDGPAGSGKSALLRDFAEATPDTALIDAAGLSTEAVLDRVMRSLGVSYGDYRDAYFLVDYMEEQEPAHSLVLVSNTQWAGRTRSTTEPRHTAEHLAGNLGLDFRKTGVRFVIEVDSEVHDLSPRNGSPLRVDSRPATTRAPFDSLPARQRTAILALSLAEPRRIRLEEWSALCSLLGAEFDRSELQSIADESEYISINGDSDLPVSFIHESDAQRLRNTEVSPEEFRAFHNAVFDRLFAAGDDDPLGDYLARALPAHAAVVGRFEELLAVPSLFVKCNHTALIEALPVAFPDGIPAGSFAADLHYLDALGVAPSSDGEWVSLLHLLAVSQGDEERADALTEQGGPLPWKTVWSHWRAPSRLRTNPPRSVAVDQLHAGLAQSTVTGLTKGGGRQVWDAATGQLLEEGNRGDTGEAMPGGTAQTAVWRAEQSWNLARLTLAGDPSTTRQVQAPTVGDVICVGDLVVLGGKRGIYAIEPNLHYTDSAPLRALPAVGPRGKITPRPYDEAACRPTRARVLEIFRADTVPTLTEDQLPAGLTHEPTRRFLTEVGLPAVSDFYSLNLHNLLVTGLAEHRWEGARDFGTPVGDGPFYELGTWIGGVLLLDGPTGRVLRQTRPGAVDDSSPGEPLAGSSLASFVAMVCLQREYMLAYRTSGGLDGEDLLVELTAWLSVLDPAAAATQNWGHVLDEENFYYL
ncbi:SUKH-4 family immunity protein [Streptomyces sp. NPDC051104]|uniref:SUKH-4 family immunity protein n=1 Tax=Streptomyces sp. NPDC051104 TaxID=3155044 RepID=UPI00342E3DEB